MKRLFFILSLLIFSSTLLFSQQRTVGLLQYEEQSYEGYTLFHPLFSTTTYLIDNCGREVNRWESEFFPAASVYLLDNGLLLRTANTSLDANPVFQIGGAGERAQLMDWDGNIVWDFVYSDSTHRMHHDIEPLPNGNVLILSWELKTYDEAIAAGRDPALLPDSVVWSEQVIEVDTATDSIVWEWHLWDHLIQDFDDTKDNFGEVGRHPERLDINFTGGPTADGGDDWLHLNSIDYNPDRDEIMLTSPFLNELYVIDHSTTTEEAAGSRGGQWNSGGDFLFRWGNPQAYDQGGPEDRQLYFVHDAHWIPADLEDGGEIMLFNNGDTERPYSSVDIIEPPIDNYLFGSYVYVPGNPFLPRSPAYQYVTDPPEDFFSSFISGAQRLPNGNTLICSGAQGRLFEITPEEEIVWEYINPVTNTGPLAYDVEELPIFAGRNANIVFRATRYPVDYPGLQGRDLTPGDPLETELPAPYDCQLLTDVEVLTLEQFNAYPSPARDLLYIDYPEGVGERLRVFNARGQLQAETMLRNEQSELNVGGWPAGIYFLQVERGVRKVIIQR